ncbi:hypothetical protein BN961_00538 [Afipia felis]|uniref:Uncharacterized protein n=1 Tax=Afipia felis TaxID=1035 RepID=A0A090MHZ5_AFIFE|nr:hypothetical protein BN961_00538 [Afipia felis]
MRDSTVSRPTLSATMTSPPLWFSVPPISCAPASLVTGIDSPVTIDSSTAERPSFTVPSTGTVSPGRTRNRSPTTTASSAMSSSVPFLMRRAVFGASDNRARMAPDVFSRARNSSTCPSSTSVTITIADSKYTATPPCMSRNASGNACGASTAATL